MFKLRILEAILTTQTQVCLVALMCVVNISPFVCCVVLCCAESVSAVRIISFTDTSPDQQIDLSTMPAVSTTNYSPPLPQSSAMDESDCHTPLPGSWLVACQEQNDWCYNLRSIPQLICFSSTPTPKWFDEFEIKCKNLQECINAISRTLSEMLLLFLVYYTAKHFSTVAFILDTCPKCPK